MTSEAKPPTVVFDLDGTLIDSLPDIIASFQHSFTVYNLPVPSEAEVRAEIGKPLEEMFATFAPAHVHELSRAYRSHYAEHATDRTVPYPGVLELLGTLRQRGYLLAVATTKRTDTALYLARALGLTDYLDVIQGTDDFPHKPAPDVILRALTAVAGEGVWMVGDTQGDIRAGRAAGLKTYAVTWGTQAAEQLKEAEPDEIQPDLQKLLTHLPPRPTHPNETSA